MTDLFQPSRRLKRGGSAPDTAPPVPRRVKRAGPGRPSLPVRDHRRQRNFSLSPDLLRRLARVNRRRGNTVSQMAEHGLEAVLALDDPQVEQVILRRRDGGGITVLSLLRPDDESGPMELSAPVLECDPMT